MSSLFEEIKNVKSFEKALCFTMGYLVAMATDVTLLGSMHFSCKIMIYQILMIVVDLARPMSYLDRLHLINGTSYNQSLYETHIVSHIILWPFSLPYNI